MRRNSLRFILYCISIAVAATGLLIISILWCVRTWTTAGKFMFFTTDVVLGFRSEHGWLQWIEDAPWENKEYVDWSLPWAVVFAAEALMIVLAVLLLRYRLRRTRGLPHAPAVRGFEVTPGKK